MNNITTTLSEQEFDRLAELIADNPEFAKKLVDAISAKLDEKFGFQQGWMKDQVDKLSGEIDRLSSDMTAGFRRVAEPMDTVEHNFKMMGERQDLFERKTEFQFKKIDRKVDSIDRRSDKIDQRLKDVTDRMRIDYEADVGPEARPKGRHS